MPTLVTAILTGLSRHWQETLLFEVLESVPPLQAVVDAERAIETQYQSEKAEARRRKIWIRPIEQYDSICNEP